MPSIFIVTLSREFEWSERKEKLVKILYIHSSILEFFNYLSDEIAGKAVILTTGGFSSDHDNETSLLSEFAPSIINLPTTNGNVGILTPSSTIPSSK
jgi:hypothetical protein